MNYYSLKSGLLVTATLVFFQCSSIQAQQERQGEKWIGIHNLSYESLLTPNTDSVAFINGQSVVRLREEWTTRWSLGFHYRLILGSQGYHEFELIAFDREIEENISRLQVVGQLPMEPTQGLRQVSNHFRVGYRRGKLLRFHDRFSIDGSIGIHPSFERSFLSPATSAIFPERNLHFSLTLDARLGFNLHIYKSLNIGYSIAPLASSWSWKQKRTENPTLTEEQQTATSAVLHINSFENPLDFRNVSLRYVFPGKTRVKRK